MSRLMTVIYGAARILDIYGVGTQVTYNRIIAKRDNRSDSEKIAGDMEKVADDLNSAISRYKLEITDGRSHGKRA
ncbi:hypothetical protein [Maridesulfovibrio zosterae]|uniref:hypothetical protein n=1 Tax=Maridesulfovibrio zosterae TaxID=82171 RepID=UPI00040E2514|nr:hypothetical protein [Maridesulfovibrio zosterae]